MSRPTLLLEKEIRNKLIQSITLGASYQSCCDYAGISYDTFKNWINRGKKAIEENIKQDDIYITFFTDIKKAKSAGKIKSLSIIFSDASWQSKAWLLERQYPQEFGREARPQNDGIERSKEITVTYRKSRHKDES